MPLSVASSSASSSSSESDLDSGDQAEHNRKRNSELIVKHFRQAQAKARTSPGSKVWQKLDNAIVDARLALLEVSWSGLLKALKTIEDGLQQAHFGSKLEWRIPVLYHLREDIVRKVQAAIPEKRTLPGVEAKSLSIIKQKLLRDRHLSPLWKIDLDDKPPHESNIMSEDELIIDCFELALLTSTNGSKSTLILAYLDLTELPALLKDLPLLEQWYGSFGSPEHCINVFDGLDLHHNSLSGLPDWLWTSLPNLRDLDLSDNPLVYLPPVVIAFEHLERLYTDQPDRLPKSNMEELVNEARMRRIQQTRPCVPSLTMLCTQVLRKSEYNPEEYTIPHLRRYWDIPWYVCASCKEIILLGDAYYLPVPLRERFTRFEPCVTELSPNGQLPPGTHKRTFMVSSPTWTFCASCLILHTQDSSIESSEQCRCTLCSASRRLWSKKKAIRWAKQHVASLKMDAVL